MKIQIIKINGILCRDNVFASFFGGTDIDALIDEFESAIENKEISGILLDINSPGGDVNGVPELAQMIYEARGIKPIYAYVRYLGASGGYWIASAAEKIFMHESASVGSIGIMAEFYNEQTNSTTVVSSISPMKNLDPGTPEGLASLQRQLDEYGMLFVSNIAQFRGTTIENVLEKYGKGDILISFNALKAGMIDGIKTFKSTLAEFNKKGDTKLINNLLSKFKSQEQPEEDGSPQSIPVEKITPEWLKEYLPEIVKQLQDEATASERERIKSLCDGEEKMNDEEKKEAKIIFHQAKFEKPRGLDSIYSELFQKKQERVSKIKQDTLDDAGKIPAINNVQSTSKQAEIDAETLDYLKKKKGVK